MKIEGIPDGWEPVRFDYANDGDAYLGGNGEILRHLSPRPTLAKRLIVRKIKKPKKPKQYRAFENAAEFEPFRDRWIQRSDLSGKGCFKGHAYDDKGIYDLGARFTYQEMFDDGRQFDDGTPFGIEVTG